MEAGMNDIKLGISACLMGEQVRYDGGHKHDRFLTQTLGAYVTYYPVCPEVECGLTVPREAMRLVGDPQNPRLMTRKTGIDHTDQMVAWAEKRVKELENENLCGFIFKSKSPSSGMQRVKVYSDSGMPALKGVGLFARIFMDHFPLVPVEEEGRLHDPILRETFIEQIFTMRRWRETISKNKNLKGLIDFHTRHKLLLLSHNQKLHRQMGKLVADGSKSPTDVLFSDYEKLLMNALRLKTTIKKNINVMQHMMGYFKKQLSPDEKQELLEIFDMYRLGHVPLVVPITLINHYVRKYQDTYLKKQVYLNPHPIALKLRNHA
jgi:uncharacterized protein YbgA (DUF1722 family)/uncharacterized protein YbbK (DUF523 family)